MKKKVKLNEMEMFQTVKVRPNVYFHKVPAGWVFESWSSEGGTSSCFIPRSKEVGNQEYEVIN